ncbi:MAG: hypothetical protein HKN35_15695 [Woeseia sp.]|nr:YlbD family protein [Woeseia sp.]MBT8097964.1 YlbD family protein [Woeseia sp.]NNE62336.1 hypothetical protein [Woeseia sp.]NNL55373.1 hypothetical protein [Woeseia sp.]
MSAEQTGSSVGLVLAVLTGCVAVSSAPAIGADELPDLALLEYLGSWEDSDEDWMLFDEEDEVAVQESTDSAAAEGEESQESDDER